MPSIRLVDLDENEIVVIRPQFPSGVDPIACTEFDLGWPEHRESVHERAGMNGSVDLTTLHGPRTISFDLRLFDWAGGSKEDLLNKLHDVSVPGKRLYVYARRDGWQEERRMLVRTSALSCSSTRISASMFTTSLSYTCPSGQMESANVSTTIINPPISAGAGIEFPITWPEPGIAGISFDPGSSAGRNYITNYGNMVAPVRMVLTGRCESPTIYNRTTGEQITFVGLTLAESESLVIDTETGSVIVGSSSYYSKIDWTYSSWWGLAPGTNEIELAASNVDENCQLTVTSRARWI